VIIHLCWFFPLLGKTLSSTGKKGHDGEEPWEEEDASISEQRPEQQLEESFEQSDAHFQGNMVSVVSILKLK